MERLTPKYVTTDFKTVEKSTLEHCKGQIPMFAGRSVLDYIHRLAELEDKIENGKYIKPHCKVGDTVYRICSFLNSQDKFIMTATIACIEIYADGVLYKVPNDYGLTEYLIGDRFNDSWFLTREEAEKRLEELRK